MKYLIVFVLALQAPLAPTGMRLVGTSDVGPQASITCPTGAVPISTTQSLQAVITANPASTTFCIKAGVHVITSSSTPRSGDVFIGEYGAILDGSTWKTTDPDAGAFIARNADIDDVTFRNLVFRNMPKSAINGYKDFSDRWTIEYNEIGPGLWGIQVPNHSIIRNNYIHHNVGIVNDPDAAKRGGGYGGFQSNTILMDSNEIAFNGQEQKFLETQNVTVRSNYAHNNVGDGIWLDGLNPNALIEDNRVEDNARNGIFYEVSSGAIIRRNVVRRSGDTAIFISNARNADISGNTLEDNFRAITYFVDCVRVVSEGQDLNNNAAHDNTIRVGSQAGAFATGLVPLSNCTAQDIATYTTSKNLTFMRNAYDVPTVSAAYWLWSGLKTFPQWQAMGQEVGGSVF